MPTKTSREADSGSPSPSYQLIDSAAELAEFCRKMSRTEIVAVDTEFIGEKSYYPSLEMIQVSDGNGLIGLIDARNLKDLEPLGDLINSSKREKVFHCVGQDLPILERALGAMPVPLFDTQLAAAMVGIGAQVSHTNLVRELLGVAIRNNQTVSDWSRRPLSPAQLAYAAEDVAYLHRLRNRLEERLRDLGRWEWMREEQSRRVEEAATSSHVPDDECYRLVKEWGKLSGQKLAILRELAAWREREARSRNVARRQIISDQALVGLARLAPSKREDVRNVRYLPQGQVYRHIDDLLPVIERARRLGPEDWPKKPSPPKLDVPVGMVELFQALARSVAETKSIAPALLATTGELQALVNNRDRLDDLDLPVLTGWRREVIGERLLALLDGRMHLRIEDRERLVIDER